MKKLMYAVILLLGLSMMTSCNKENSKGFVGKYTADEIKFDTKILTSSSEAVDLPVVTVKNVSLEIKEGTEKNLVTGYLKFGEVRGTTYLMRGECSGNEVVFDDVTVSLNDIHTASGDVSLELVLSCAGTLKSKTLSLSISYEGTGSITQNGVTKSGEIEDGVVNGVKFTKQGNSGGGGNSGNHAYVDLGLPSGTLWATCNVGASSPEEYGDYFAWGETEPKDYYEWSTYKYANGDYDRLTKYCPYNEYHIYGDNGFTDNLTVLLPEDDAATANWGSGWRMPTKEEMRELYDICNSTFTMQNGVKGRIFVGINGNTLFLPAAGYRDEGELYYAGSDGSYWSSTLDTDDSLNARSLYFGLGVYDIDYTSHYRDNGLTVRPVRSSQK